ncbi:17166_t:CDS:2, partial [Dentiscutata heterogama]
FIIRQSEQRLRCDILRVSYGNHILLSRMTDFGGDTSVHFFDQKMTNKLNSTANDRSPDEISKATDNTGYRYNLNSIRIL